MLGAARERLRLTGRRAASAVLLAGLSTCALVACGGEEPAPPDPATVVPSDAPLYVESVAKPEGDEEEALEGALSKVLNTDDPGGFITDRIDQELTEEDEDISFDEDIDPWLGERAGSFFQTFTDDPVGAVAAEVTDTGAAQEFIDKVSAGDDQPAEETSYRGIEYRLDEDENTATGIVGEFLVVGSEEGFQAAVDASQGESLAGDERFTSAREEFESDFEETGEERVATLYADVAGVLEALEDAREITAQDRQTFEEAIGEAAEASVLAGIGASDDSLGFDLSVPLTEPEAAPATESAELLAELPGEAWAALGLNDLGESLTAGLEQLDALPGAPPGGISAAIQRETGIDVRDYVSWLGDVALFVEGTSPLDVGGGAVIETTDPDASGRAIAGLEGLLRRELRGEAEVGPLDLEGGGEGFSIQPPGAPDQLHVVQRDDRVAVVYGDEAAEQAFEPSEALGEAEIFETAEGSLGEEFGVSGFLDLEPALELAEAGGASEDPDYTEAKPYLDHLDFLAFGGRVADNRGLFRIAVGLE